MCIRDSTRIALLRRYSLDGKKDESVLRDRVCGGWIIALCSGKPIIEFSDCLEARRYIHGEFHRAYTKLVSGKRNASLAGEYDYVLRNGAFSFLGFQHPGPDGFRDETCYFVVTLPDEPIAVVAMWVGYPE